MVLVSGGLSFLQALALALAACLELLALTVWLLLVGAEFLLVRSVLKVMILSALLGLAMRCEDCCQKIFQRE